MKVATLNMMNYGEVGERLSGIRDSEIYQQSAKKIENFVINEMGNVKIAKELQAFPIRNMPSNIDRIFDTRYNFYICLCGNKIVTLQKDFERYNNAVREQREIGAYKQAKYIDEKLFILSQTGQVTVYEFNAVGSIGTSNFMSLVQQPIEEKQEITMDLYKIYKVGNELRVALIGTHKNPTISIRNRNMYFSNSNMRIEKLYLNYRTFSNPNEVSGAKENMVFGVLHKYFRDDTVLRYLVGNSIITFNGNDIVDTVVQNYSATGELSFGKIVDLNFNITDIGIFRDRLFFVRNNTFFFSEVSNYFNFRNGIKASDPFFFKPTPINNIFPNIIGVESGNKIYVATDKGVYVISAYQTFTSSSYSVFVASEIPCRENGVLIEDDFYYISTENTLKCVQMIPNAQGYESYSVVDVEKYDIYTEPERIQKWKYDDRLMLAVTKKTRDSNESTFSKICLYQSLEFNIFRRFTIDTKLEIEKGKLLTIDKYLVKEKTFYREGRNNVEKAILAINPPSLGTEQAGRYGNDYSSMVERVFVKVLNQNQDAIKEMIIDGTPIKKFPEEEDIFSVFRLDKSFPIKNGYTIEVVTKRNDKIFEILGIDTLIRVNAD